MPLLTLKNIAKAYQEIVILKDISFTIEDNDKIGLIGVNGSGKTTLIRILTSQIEADSGEISKSRELSIGYLPQEPVLPDDQSIREFVQGGLAEWYALHQELSRVHGELTDPSNPVAMEKLLTVQNQLQTSIELKGGWDREFEVDQIMADLGLPPENSLIHTLSSGEKKRVYLARILLARPKLLILDEPTNHLDVPSIEWLENCLQGYAGALLMVTHDRYFLERISNRILELDRSGLYEYPGNYQTYLEQKASRLQQEQARQETRICLLRKELAWMRQGAKARSTKQKARVDRFHELKDEVYTPLPEELRLVIPLIKRLGTSILEIRHLDKSFGPRRIIKNLSLIMKKKERIFVVGPNGAGKSSLMKIILGQLAADAGEVVVGQNTEFGYIDQNRDQLHDEKSVFEELGENNEYVQVGTSKIHVRGFLRRFLFDAPRQQVPVGSLSGGERMRLLLAKLLTRGANFLLLDEPTNDLDIATLQVLEDALLGFEGCALIVSHDRYFLNRVATGLLIFEGDGRVEFFEGNYDLYRELQKQNLAQAAKIEKKKTTDEGKTRIKPPSKKLSYKEQQQLEQVELAIEQNEAEIVRLEAILADPEVYRKPGTTVSDTCRRIDQVKADLTLLYDQWEALELKRS